MYRLVQKYGGNMTIKLNHKIKDHPTVLKIKSGAGLENKKKPLSLHELRNFSMPLFADDLGIVSIERAEVSDQVTYIKKALPSAKTLISIVHKLNPDAIRSPYRSIANTEFHHNYEQANEKCRHIVDFLIQHGAQAIAPASGFPMEMDEYPGRTWVVSHKPVAVAAGLGQMGINRNILHEKFGNFINLSTIITDMEFVEESIPINFNPCVGCRLCVKACPVGAISPDGTFNFSTCLTHNYNEFMTGFNTWVDTIVNSKNSKEFGQHYSQAENASMWQSLSFKANYKAAYCMAVCPAGEEVMPLYLSNKEHFNNDIVRPLIDKEETLYVLKNSDAEVHAKKFKNKKIKIVRNIKAVKDVNTFLRGLPIFFQPLRSKGFDFSIKFKFTGNESLTKVVTIRNEKIMVTDEAEIIDLEISISSDDWLKFIKKEIGLLKLLFLRKLKFKGKLTHLKSFGKCFP